MILYGRQLRNHYDRRKVKHTGGNTHSSFPAQSCFNLLQLPWRQSGCNFTLYGVRTVDYVVQRALGHHELWCVTVRQDLCQFGPLPCVGTDASFHRIIKLWVYAHQVFGRSLVTWYWWRTCPSIYWISSSLSIKVKGLTGEALNPHSW